jgi:hypothetical protein
MPVAVCRGRRPRQAAGNWHLLQNTATLGKKLIIKLCFLEKNVIFCPKLWKIAENGDNYIDPWNFTTSKLPSLKLT